MFVLCLCMYQADDSKDEKKKDSGKDGDDSKASTTLNIIQNKLNQV